MNCSPRDRKMGLHPNADELTSAGLTGESYSYDQDGNRVGSGYQTGAANELLSDGVFNYQYDKDGNRVQGDCA